jgi:predicted ATPase
VRLTQIKLAGFKSFVDPTTIATPGQLVGIVGPNGCGKSNVIDAVRWVLGESKASALRGESMQDVIFNGAGERKPVGRASVELHFDNSLGRIGGQWGQYAEISIKRVLTRDGDSTYYINNIPVRRRDIHDLFLGTGLGPRAYAIIEQGMISRVIEAKPEELRIFLEEAAGVSKYKERRKETEGRLSDTRENLARVEDIRTELSNQLTHLEGQAQVATQYRELEARLKSSQHMLWYAKQQDAARSRERCATEIATLTVALESVQAELRAAEARLESLRAEHYGAGDALHERQGAFYAANAEVTRLEQQIAFARESETRITQQVAQLTEALGAIAGQEAALAADRTAADAALAGALVARETASADEAAAQTALPALEADVAAAGAALAERQQEIAQTEQGLRVAETRRDSAAQALAQLEERRERLAQELADTAPAATDSVRDVEDQLAQENADLAGKQAGLAALRTRVEALQGEQRATADVWERESKRLADLEARQQALAALQDRIGHGADIDGWLDAHGLVRARRLWQLVDIDAGWEDALEAVLRERLSGLELAPPATAPTRRTMRCCRRCASSNRTSPGCWSTAWPACAAGRTSRPRSRSAGRSPSVKRSSRPAGTSFRRKAWRSSRRTASCTACSRGSASWKSSTARSPPRAQAPARPAPGATRSTPSLPWRSRPITPKASRCRRSSGACTTSNWNWSSCSRRPRRPRSGARRSPRNWPTSTRSAPNSPGSATRSWPRSPTCSRGCTTNSPGARQRGTHATKRRSRWRAAASVCAWPSVRRRRRASPNAAAATGWPSSSGAAKGSSRRARSSRRCSRS